MPTPKHRALRRNYRAKRRSAPIRAATSKRVSFMVIALDRIVDGTIVAHWALPDFFGLLQQIGGAIVPGDTELEWR